MHEIGIAWMYFIIGAIIFCALVIYMKKEDHFWSYLIMNLAVLVMVFGAVMLGRGYGIGQADTSANLPEGRFCKVLGVVQEQGWVIVVADFGGKTRVFTTSDLTNRLTNGTMCRVVDGSLRPQ